MPVPALLSVLWPLCFVGRPSSRTAGWRAPTIAVRSLRSGLPLRHLRQGLRPFLQIPSGASRLLATQPSATTCCVRFGLVRCWSCGRGRVLGCPSLSAARAAENDIRDLLDCYCGRWRGCGQALAIGLQRQPWHRRMGVAQASRRKPDCRARVTRRSLASQHLASFKPKPKPKPKASPFIPPKLSRYFPHLHPAIFRYIFQA